MEEMIFEKQVREEMWFPPPRSDWSGDRVLAVLLHKTGL